MVHGRRKTRETWAVRAAGPKLVWLVMICTRGMRRERKETFGVWIHKFLVEMSLSAGLWYIFFLKPSGPEKPLAYFPNHILQNKRPFRCEIQKESATTFTGWRWRHRNFTKLQKFYIITLLLHHLEVLWLVSSKASRTACGSRQSKYGQPAINSDQCRNINTEKQSRKINNESHFYRRRR